jgi:hypothetical protein
MDSADDELKKAIDKYRGLTDVHFDDDTDGSRPQREWVPGFVDTIKRRFMGLGEPHFLAGFAMIGLVAIAWKSESLGQVASALSLAGLATANLLIGRGYGKHG